ncbi:MAG: hypothetical protein SVV80_10265 [Planctomycetota bacterium]|nr:hypothetical protein [Planctomycetota bacterium]
MADVSGPVLQHTDGPPGGGTPHQTVRLRPHRPAHSFGIRGALPAGAGGSDRITIIWADNSIAKQWLQVTVKATAATGLAEPDVFYFGNAIGETGNSPTDATVKPTDEIGARNNPHTLGGPEGPAGIDDVYDFNRDKKVGPTDEIIARTNGTSSLTALKLITVP